MTIGLMCSSESIVCSYWHGFTLLLMRTLLFAFLASHFSLCGQRQVTKRKATRPHGPSGSLRCSIYRGATKLVAALLRHPVALFPDKSALLARTDGTRVRAHSNCRFSARSAAAMREKNTRTETPFAWASSAGLAGKRAAACLRLEEPSSADPRRAEQRSEPEGPRCRGALGVVRENGQAFPLTRRKGET